MDCACITGDNEDVGVFAEGHVVDICRIGAPSKAVNLCGAWDRKDADNRPLSKQKGLMKKS